LNRDKRFDFSLPYLQSYGQYLINAPSSIHSTDDLSKKTFGVPADSVYIFMLTELFGNDVKIKSYYNYPQMMADLSNNVVDVLVLDQASATYWLSNGCPHCKLLGDRFPYGFGYGILANKNKTVLIAQINRALLSMESDGTYLKIYNTYF
jgi:arginine transport system substrate-binding protein